MLCATYKHVKACLKITVLQSARAAPPMGRVCNHELAKQNQGGRKQGSSALEIKSSVEAASAGLCTTCALDRLSILLYLKLQGHGCKHEG